MIQETTADGRRVTTTVSLVGGTKLVKRQLDRADRSKNTVDTMEFRQNGNVMVWTGTIPSDRGIRSVRTYKRKGIKTRATSGC